MLGENDAADDTGRSSQRRRKACGIAVVNHLGDQDAADCGNGRRCGTGDCSEEHTGDNRNHAEGAGHPAEELIAQVDDLLGDTALAHDDAGKNEQGDSHQNGGVERSDHSLRGDEELGRLTVGDERRDGGKADADRDRRADHDEHCQRNK